MQAVKHAIISAAGMGSRLGLDNPKSLVEFKGKRLIDYQLKVLETIESVYIVVGFKEKEVMDHVRKVREDAIFVRNPHYRTTSNAYSLSLASERIKEPFLTLDGDLLINPTSFKKFLERCKEGQTLIGVSKAKTEEALFAKLDKKRQVVAFSFNEKSSYEWSGIAYLKNIPISRKGGFVFQELEPHLPLASHVIDCHEIDTPKDLSNAMHCFQTLEYEASL